MPNIILAARGRITTHFLQDIGRGWLHRGIDQGHGDGLPVDLEIRAPADGVVTFAGLFGSYGLVIFITHDDGWVSVLAHHARHLVVKGARVKQGQLIAVMGNSGTKYVHSHQELRNAKGEQVDPLRYVKAPTTAAAATKPIPHKRRNKSMSTGWYTDRENRTPPVATDWALAGDGQGEAAWLPVSGPTAQDVAEVHGPFVYLNVRSYDSFKARYLGTPPVA